MFSEPVLIGSRVIGVCLSSFVDLCCVTNELSVVWCFIAFSVTEVFNGGRFIRVLPAIGEFGVCTFAVLSGTGVFDVICCSTVMPVTDKFDVVCSIAVISSGSITVRLDVLTSVTIGITVLSLWGTVTVSFPGEGGVCDSALPVSVTGCEVSVSDTPGVYVILPRPTGDICVFSLQGTVGVCVDSLLITLDVPVTSPSDDLCVVSFSVTFTECLVPVPDSVEVYAVSVGVFVVFPLVSVSKYAVPSFSVNVYVA